MVGWGPEGEVPIPVGESEPPLGDYSRGPEDRDGTPIERLVAKPFKFLLRLFRWLFRRNRNSG